MNTYGIDSATIEGVIQAKENGDTAIELSSYEYDEGGDEWNDQLIHHFRDKIRML